MQDPSSVFGGVFFEIMAILGSFGGPFETRGGSKTPRKIIHGHFLALGPPLFEAKVLSGRGFGKSKKNDEKINGFWLVWDAAETLNFLSLCGQEHDFHFFEILGKTLEKHLKIGRPKGIKNDLKIETLATRGGPGGARDRLRQLLGVFWRHSIFDDFSFVRKKSA